MTYTRFNNVMREQATTCNPQTIPFDPPGEAPTTDHLDAYKDHGRPMLNNYTRYARVGKGHHGEVYLCYKLNPRLPHGNPERRLPVAMKSVKRDNPRAQQYRMLQKHRLPRSDNATTPLADRLNTTEAKIRKEIAIMKKCRHPHVVRLYEVIDDRMKDKIYMVMEYLGGGEVKWRNDQGLPILTVEQTRRIMRDAILGLEYLHHQGIIHRDIKPANLLWTEDRHHVKIGDFGVSHFSYAQRLQTAAGRATIAARDDPTDPVLLDDSDLTRRAGTPSFLAPEVVFEHFSPEMAKTLFDIVITPAGINSSSSRSSSVGHGTSSSKSSNSHLARLNASTSSVNNGSKTGPNGEPLLHTLQYVPMLAHYQGTRPPITKSIDIWALGVTLFCLLFGKTPFNADSTIPGSEWSLYNAICNQDWEPEETMGFDKLPTGGRHPTNKTSEGGIVMTLLDQLLKKGAKSRLELHPFKSNPWFLRDLADPPKWLRETSPTKISAVSAAEATQAMAPVLFSWNWGKVVKVGKWFKKRPKDDGPTPTVERGLAISEPARYKDSGSGSARPQVESTPNFNDKYRYRHKGRQTSSQTSTQTVTIGATTLTPSHHGVSSSPSYGAMKRPRSNQSSVASRTRSIDRLRPPSRQASEKFPSVEALKPSLSVSTNIAPVPSPQPSPTMAEKPEKKKSLMSFLKRPSKNGKEKQRDKEEKTVGSSTSQTKTTSGHASSSWATSSTTDRQTSTITGSSTPRRSDEPLKHHRSAQDTTSFQRQQASQQNGAYLGYRQQQNSQYPAATPSNQQPHHNNYSQYSFSGPKRASSWAQQGDKSNPRAAGGNTTDVASLQSANDLQTMIVGAGGVSSEREGMTMMNGLSPSGSRQPSRLNVNGISHHNTGGSASPVTPGGFGSNNGGPTTPIASSTGGYHPYGRPIVDPEMFHLQSTASSIYDGDDDDDDEEDYDHENPTVSRANNRNRFRESTEIPDLGFPGGMGVPRLIDEDVQSYISESDMRYGPRCVSETSTIESDTNGSASGSWHRGTDLSSSSAGDDDMAGFGTIGGPVMNGLTFEEFGGTPLRSGSGNLGDELGFGDEVHDVRRRISQLNIDRAESIHSTRSSLNGVAAMASPRGSIRSKGSANGRQLGKGLPQPMRGDDDGSGSDEQDERGGVTFSTSSSRRRLAQANVKGAQ